MAQDPSTSCSRSGSFECCQATSDVSPFFISDEYYQGDKQYDNFREIEDDTISKRYIPRGTIIYTPPELYNLESSKDFRLPFKVLSVPNEKLEETAKGTLREFFKKMFWGKKGKKRVKEGDVGFMDKRSIRKISDYSFIVNENSPAFKSPKGNLLNGKMIKPAMIDDKFLVSRCCKLKDVWGVSISTPEDEKQCQDFHYFQVFNEKNDLIENISMYDLGCNFLTNLTVIPNEDIEPLSKITNLLSESKKISGVYSEAGVESLELIYEKNNWKGSRLLSKPKIKLIKLPIHPKTGVGPYNTRHYTPDDKGNSDAFITPSAGCSFLQLAKNFSEKCSGYGCQIQFGNAYHERDWGPHGTHGSGECIDVRPFRKTDDDINRGLTHSHTSRYDKDKTKLFIETAIRAGATQVWFNDPDLLNEYEPYRAGTSISPLLDDKPSSPYFNDWWEIGMRKMDLHDDHIHLCFKKENLRAQSTCKEGL